MTAPHADRLIDGYLARIRAAAEDLPAGVRNELLDDMRSHIAEARAREPEETDTTILNILDRLGEPDVVVSEARQRSDSSGVGRRGPAPYRPGIIEIAALVLLPFVWPVGVVLLWVSPAWKVRDKLIGSLLPPGGYPGIFIIVAMSHHAVMISGGSGSGPGLIDVVGALISVMWTLLFFLLPVITVVYLAIRLRWGRGSPEALPA